MEMIPVSPPITDYLHKKAAALGIPISGNFELTPCCNLKCKMCYVQEQVPANSLHSADEWITLAEQAKEEGMLYLLLTGGEIFTRDDLPYIMQQLHRMGLLVSINTNGTLIDDRVIAWLKKCPPIRINVTLYGASEDTYHELCGNGNAYYEAREGVERLKKNGFSVKINYSTTPLNLKDVKEVDRFCKRCGVPLDPTCYMYPQTRKDDSSTGKNICRFSPEEAGRAGLEIARIIGGDEWLYQRINKDGIPNIEIECKEPLLDIDEGSSVWCGAGRNSFWVTWRGEMQACSMLPSNQNTNDVFQAGFKAEWERVRQETMKIRLPVECSQCDIKKQCMACAAIVFTETGTFDTVPDYRCRMMKEHIKQCKMFADDYESLNK